MLEATDAELKRFYKYVKKLPNGCWFWYGGRSKGSGNRLPYGTFWYRGKSIRAHRFASEVLGGKECPPGHHRDHTCDFSLCVNPDHIEIVTHDENVARRHGKPRGQNPHVIIGDEVQGIGLLEFAELIAERSGVPLAGHQRKILESYIKIRGSSLEPGSCAAGAEPAVADQARKP